MMLSHSTLLALWLASVPPLSTTDLDRLARAVQDGDFREDAFAALVEHVRLSSDASVEATPQSTERLINSNILEATDLKQLLEDPDAYRARVFQITGRIAQITDLPPPYDDAQEWFVRLADGGATIVVYVVGTSTSDQLSVDQTFAIDAYFYKRMRFLARDGTWRQYAAFVGARPLLVHTERQSQHTETPARLWMIAGGIGIMLALLAAALAYSRITRSHRQRTRSPRSHQHFDRESSNGDQDETLRLPDDAVEALAELRRRANP